MRKYARLLVFVLSLVSVLAWQPASAKPQLRITLTQSGAELRAFYVLPQPVTEFTFHEIVIASESGMESDLIRDGKWRPGDEDLLVQGGSIRRRDGLPFSTFDLLLMPDDASLKRISPAIVRLGQGYVVNLSYLIGAKAIFESVITVDSTPGNTAITGAGEVTQRAEIFTTQSNDGSIAQFAFLGPELYVNRDAGVLVMDPDMPEWLQPIITQEIADSRAFYQQALNQPLATEPVIVIGFSSESFRAYWRGDVDGAGLVSLQFAGTGWFQQTALREEEARLFVAHEVAHLWNGDLFKGEGGEENAWLYEGGAEYFALQSLHQRGLLSNNRLDQLLTDHVNQCISEIGYRLYGDAQLELGQSAVLGEAAYDCGTVIQWFADAAMASAQQSQDIFGLWRHLFAGTDAGHDYTPEDFFTILAFSDTTGQAVRASAMILAAQQEEDWNRLPGLVSDLGIILRPAPETLTARRYLGRIVAPLLRQNCTPPYGFWVGREQGQLFVTLDAGDCDTAFPAGARVTALAGFNLFSHPEAAFDAVNDLCATSQTIPAQLISGDETSLHCASSLPPKPMAFTLIYPWASTP